MCMHVLLHTDMDYPPHSLGSLLPHHHPIVDHSRSRYRGRPPSQPYYLFQWNLNPYHRYGQALSGKQRAVPPDCIGGTILKLQSAVFFLTPLFWFNWVLIGSDIYIYLVFVWLLAIAIDPNAWKMWDSIIKQFNQNKVVWPEIAECSFKVYIQKDKGNIGIYKLIERTEE